MKKISTALMTLVAISLLTSCAAMDAKTVKKSSVQPVEPQSFINQYPTRDRVDYVLKCVARHGGLTYISQYACGCKLDKIAEKLTFKAFEAALTFGYLRKTPGEKGAAFRDPNQSKNLKKQLREVETYAEKMCFVK
ncbi:MAG: hypothetical protein Q9M50_03760 [Methylococcales bacterium]|nr:hypothetical protein [Methylococcales bacterium]